MFVVVTSSQGTIDPSTIRTVARRRQSSRNAAAMMSSAS
jgi:hypothetical protein